MKNREGLSEFQQSVYEMLSKMKGVQAAVNETTLNQTPSILELSNNLIVSGPLAAAHKQQRLGNQQKQ